MDEKTVAAYWDRNAPAWIEMSRAGYDRCRDLFNGRQFHELLGDVSGLRGLDVGCGEGHNTRLAARVGAQMTAIDMSSVFLDAARATETEDPLGIDYQMGSAMHLPFADEQFDFVMSTMCFQDVPDPLEAIRQAARVVKPGGFVQFSMTHPCFHTSKWKWVHGESGHREALLVGDYFTRATQVDTWTFGAAPAEMREKYPPFEVPYFLRTLSDIINATIDAGLCIEHIAEPTPTDEVLAEHPEEADARIIAFFLHVRASKM
jgi:ubiquinone/menaquinone biosynthesis C-methylase UbiE